MRVEGSQLLKPRELSEQINVAEGTLKYWRYMGEGPDFLRLGGRIRYNRADVERWLEKQRRVSSVRTTVERLKNVAL